MVGQPWKKFGCMLTVATDSTGELSAPRATRERGNILAAAASPVCWSHCRRVSGPVMGMLARFKESQCAGIHHPQIDL
jgi:hypothetical protein